ncbi:uncharacterized protein [Temnothorax longispinosus]|uniref:uncharacterized protein isoform X2 n=1 Tax=Temnothorax longispinosus TaxID=300112 RepID=UPI003A98E488
MNSTMDIASIKKNGNLCAMPTESIKISSTNRVAQREHEEAAGCTLSGCSLSTICSFKPSTTATNIPASEGLENQCEESNDSEDIFRSGSIGSNSSSRGSRKRRFSIDEDGPFDRLVDALGRSPAINIPPFVPPPPPPPFPPPPTQPTDKAALFGNLVAAQLREINPRLVDDVMLQVMQILTKAKKV